MNRSELLESCVSNVDVRRAVGRPGKNLLDSVKKASTSAER